jgi:uncharacterized membrane protein HdeD (DUF308 family)
MNEDRVEARSERGTVAQLLGRNWWILLLRGIAAIVLGILAFVWPRLTLLGLIYLFGIYALINGALAFSAASNAPKGYPAFGSLIFEGALSIAGGVLAFLLPGITAMALLVLIAVWAIATGITEIVSAIRLRKEISNEWWLILAGVASVVFGVVLFLFPRAGLLAMVWWLGAWGIVFGILMIGLAFRVRNVHPEVPGAAAPAAA